MRRIYIKRIFKILGLISFLNQAVISQSYNYFNNRYDISGEGLQDDCSAVLETSDGFVITGSSLVVSSNYYRWENTFTKLDPYGNLLYNKTLGEDTIDYFFSYYPGYFIKDSNCFYTVGKKRTPTANGLHDEGTLMHLDENLDTLWMKRFGEGILPYDTAFNFTCIKQVHQKDLIIAGAWKPTGLATHVYLLKVDSLGSKIWEKSFSYYNSYIEGTSIAQTTDSGFIIGCFKQTPGYPETVDPVLIKTDSLGNLEWTKNLGGPLMDARPMVSIAKDGNMVVGTTYADSMATPDIPLSRINIIKLDNQGNIIWNRKYGASQENNFLRNIRILNDSCIVSVGSRFEYNPHPDRVSWILKTSSDGDSLWYREYIYLSGQQSRNYLYDLIETSDFGLIACGWVDPIDPDTGSIDTWVIKLDNFGCEWAGCDTTVGIMEPGGEEAGGHGDKETGGQVDRGRLVIFPNPASGVLSVKVLGLSAGNNSSTFKLQPSIEIYDVFGRIARSLPPGGGRAGDGGCNWQLDVSALPPGIYMIEVRDQRSVVGTGKFVIAR